MAAVVKPIRPKELEEKHSSNPAMRDNSDSVISARNVNLRVSLEINDVPALDHPFLRFAFDLEHLVLGQHEAAHHGKPAIWQMRNNHSICRQDGVVQACRVTPPTALTRLV